MRHFYRKTFPSKTKGGEGWGCEGARLRGEGLKRERREKIKGVRGLVPYCKSRHIGYKEYIGKLISDGLTYVLTRQPTDQPRDIALCGATIMI